MSSGTKCKYSKELKEHAVELLERVLVLFLLLVSLVYLLSVWKNGCRYIEL